MNRPSPYPSSRRSSTSGEEPSWQQTPAEGGLRSSQEQRENEYMREREESGTTSLPRALMHPDWIAGRGRWAPSGSSNGGGEQHAVPSTLRALHQRNMASPLPCHPYEELYRVVSSRPPALALLRGEGEQQLPRLDTPPVSSHWREDRSLPPPLPLQPSSRYTSGDAAVPVRRSASSWQSDAQEEYRSAAYVESRRRLLDPTLAGSASSSHNGGGAYSEDHRRGTHDVVMQQSRHSPPHSRAAHREQSPHAEHAAHLRSYSHGSTSVASAAQEHRTPSAMASPPMPPPQRVGGQQQPQRVYFDSPRSTSAVTPSLPYERPPIHARPVGASAHSIVAPSSAALSGDRSPPGTDALGALGATSLDVGNSTPSAKRSTSGDGGGGEGVRALTAAEKRKGTSTESQTRRLAHLVSEQRRRFSINAGFEELRAAVPTCSEGGESKATILRRAIEYIASLEDLLRRSTNGSGSEAGREGKAWSGNTALGGGSQGGVDASISPSAYSESPVESPVTAPTSISAGVGAQRRAPAAAFWPGANAAPAATTQQAQYAANTRVNRISAQVENKAASPPGHTTHPHSATWPLDAQWAQRSERLKQQVLPSLQGRRPPSPDGNVSRTHSYSTDASTRDEVVKRSSPVQQTHDETHSARRSASPSSTPNASASTSTSAAVSGRKRRASSTAAEPRPAPAVSFLRRADEAAHLQLVSTAAAAQVDGSSVIAAAAE